MTDHASDAPAWVPPVDEAVGEERAHLLVAWLPHHARATGAHAERTLLARYPSAEIQVDTCRVTQLARLRCQGYTQGFLVGEVWHNAGDTLAPITVCARFDGTVD